MLDRRKIVDVLHILCVQHIQASGVNPVLTSSVSVW